MITGINHITLAVKNIDLSFNFYKDVLALRPLCRWDNGAYFLAGDFWFCLNVDSKRQINPCYTHYAFSVEKKDFSRLTQKIIASGATLFKENASPGDSLYFLDPDGHKLEIHVADWQSRIKAKKENSGLWEKVEWFI
jgi:catechol 2,3-dioxygenase-like lactoylglutathione lyase family enzyme